MNIEHIVKMIQTSEIPDFVFYRSFSDHKSAAALTCQINKAMDNNPDLQGVATAYIILPALKWMLSGREIDSVCCHLCQEDAHIARLDRVQSLIQESMGVEPVLFLRKREEYFSACENLVQYLEDTVENIGAYPEKGQIYQTVLRCFFDSGASYYYISKYLDETLTVVLNESGDRIEEMLDVILDGTLPVETEKAYLYHNLKLLLAEYNRIIWRAEHSDDLAMQLLSCTTEEEMQLITNSYTKYGQAHLLVQYIKFINGAIEMVKTFPNGGAEYCHIIKTIVKLKAQGCSDKDISLELNMSHRTFGIKRQRAYAVLSSILWGCDGSAFVNMLVEK